MAPSGARRKGSTVRSSSKAYTLETRCLAQEATTCDFRTLAVNYWALEVWCSGIEAFSGGGFMDDPSTFPPEF